MKKLIILLLLFANVALAQKKKRYPDVYTDYYYDVDYNTKKQSQRLGLILETMVGHTFKHKNGAKFVVKRNDSLIIFHYIKQPDKITQ